MTATTLPYGEWPSPLDTRDVFSRPGVPQFPERVDGAIYWIQSLPAQAGRQVLMRHSDDGDHHQLTPDSFNIRTRVHEYGGRCHVFSAGQCWFVNFQDQRLYRQPLTGVSPVAVTPPLASPGAWMLADLVAHPSGRWLVAVGERTRKSAENENAIVVVDLQADAEEDNIISPLAVGHDFYSSPRFSADGSRLCYVHWDHPSMPWDDTELVECLFDNSDGVLSNINQIAGGKNACVCQPAWRADNALLFMRDRQGKAAEDDFWNIHVWQAGNESPVTCERAEYGAAHWVFGHNRLCPLDDERVLAVRTDEQGESLVIASSTGVTNLSTDTDYILFSQLSPLCDGKVLLVAQSTQRGASVVAVDGLSGALVEIQSGTALLDLQDVSTAVALSSPTRDGKTTHAWAYSPCSSRYQGPADSSPPLMVLVHGGPTSQATAAFDPLRQFWTTRGFAVLDINHRGSTGFGRRYRQTLNGLWGELDVDDVIDVIAHFTSTGKADPQRVFIRGGSAGGFVVLAALTRYPDVFTAGACYYGIGNLETLATTTHKFESRYTDTLLGEAWHESLAGREDTVYFTRSPIHRMHQVRSPMILFQGSEDRVVPPEVSREVVHALEQNGVKHRYVEYAGEGHGFRSAPNRIDALESELAFFAALS